MYTFRSRFLNPSPVSVLCPYWGLLFIVLLARNFQSDHSRLRVASGHENIRIKVLYWCSIVYGSTDINTVLIYMVAQNVVSPSQHGL